MERVTAEKLTLGGKTFTAMRMQLEGPALLVIVSEAHPDTILACGYVDVTRAEKWNHAMAIVSGVDSFKDMLEAEVKALSPKAEQKGATVGMRGSEFLEKLG
ncbi:YunC family protein [Candidatus Micrarchaeota archaeon]|nr:YunC family protein [Candidatus Micrarchaeota archaeon]